MSSRRVPLFSVSVAFAIGCMAGIDGLMTWPIALVLFIACLPAWIFLARYERSSLTVFYFLAVCGGLTHTLLLAASVAPDDVRRLSDEKLLATTQWRARVIEEPVTQASPHVGRRRLDRTSFVVEMEAWRPTGGQFFGGNIEQTWQRACGQVDCTVLGPAQEIRGGDELEFAAPLVEPARTLSPGQFDFRAWSAQRGIYYQTTIGSRNWTRLENGAGFWWRGISYRLRDWAYARLQLGLEDDPRTADFLSGMLIGYRQEIPADIEQEFRQTGTLHVFAISGQNIAEMLVVVVVLLQLCGLVRWRWAWMLAPVVLLYCMLAGSPASAVRATVMALAILLAWRLGRPLNALGCWSIAFLAMLIWKPVMLLDFGAQLSFAVVLGLIMVSPPIYRWMAALFQPDLFLPARLLTTWQKREERAWAWFVGLMAASLAATVVSEPITAVDFYQVTPISIVANLLVVPLAGLITVVGTISVASSLICPPLAVLFNNANWAFARVLILIVHYFAHGPGAAINVPDLRALGASTPFFVAAPIQDSACLLVRTEGHAWLVDAGREAAAPSIPGRLLQFYGINRLDGLILAQMSGPDNGGAALMVQQFRPRRLIVPALESRSPLRKQIPQLAAMMGAPPESWRRGAAFDLGPRVCVDVLGPALDSSETRENNRSLVLLFHSGAETLLWAGRIDASGQEELALAYPHLHADVLVMGSQSPPDAAWLKSLGVRAWMRIPSPLRDLNTPFSFLSGDAPRGVWPLDQTGAVTIRFDDARDGREAGVFLQPWAALPTGP